MHDTALLGSYGLNLLVIGYLLVALGKKWAITSQSLPCHIAAISQGQAFRESRFETFAANIVTAETWEYQGDLVCMNCICYRNILQFSLTQHLLGIYYFQEKVIGDAKINKSYMISNLKASLIQ